MKKLVLVLTVALFLLGLSACGGGKYADVKALMNKMIDANEEFAAAADKAKNVDDAIAALNDLAKAMEGVIPKMKEMSEKYSELKGQDPPEELKSLNEKMQAASKKTQEAMMKLGGVYGTDPKFQEAMMKMAGAAAGK